MTILCIAQVEIIYLYKPSLDPVCLDKWAPTIVAHYYVSVCIVMKTCKLFSSSMPSTASNRNQVVSLKLSCLPDDGVVGGEYTVRVSELTLACLCTMHTLVYEAVYVFWKAKCICGHVHEHQAFGRVWLILCRGYWSTYTETVYFVDVERNVTFLYALSTIDKCKIIILLEISHRRFRCYLS